MTCLSSENYLLHLWFISQKSPLFLIIEIKLSYNQKHTGRILNFCSWMQLSCYLNNLKMSAGCEVFFFQKSFINLFHCYFKAPPSSEFPLLINLFILRLTFKKNCLPHYWLPSVSIKNLICIFHILMTAWNIFKLPKLTWIPDQNS